MDFKKEHIPYPFFATDAPVDISFVFQDEKPAGRHGFIQSVGGAFAFEDGTPARFWGVNFNGGACFPTHAYAEQVARRLAKMGQNIVRFHQLDAEWNTPNIFQLTKGRVLHDTRALDAESLDRLDYLIYALKNEGIYVYLDLLTYRRFRTGDGVENAVELGDAAKPYCIYNPRMIQLQKEYAAQLFTHYNPYTGLEYRNDPAIVLTEIVNECDLFSGAIKVEPYATEFRTLLRTWLDENNLIYDAEHCSLECMDEPLIRFKNHLHDAYYEEMYEYLRQMGVKIPITGTNWTQHTGLFRSNAKLDFTDNHSYYYDWRWGEREKLCMNRGMTQTDDFGFVKLCHMRSLNKPFFCSEWDVPWPNEFRAESPVLWAALGSFQDWSGFAIHTYSYLPSQEQRKILGKELWSDAIGGIPYREGIYAVWNDPAKMGLFYHSALIMRRGDVAPAKETYAVKMDPEHAKERIPVKDKTITETARYNAGLYDVMAPALTGISEVHKVGACTDQLCNVDRILTEPVPAVDLERKELAADNGQLYRNWDKNYGWIDSERTKCVYGFLGKNEPVQLRGLRVACQNDFAVIAMSSLTDQSLEESDNILLTTVGRAENHDAVFDGERMIAWGTEPVEVEVICAEIRLKTSRRNLKVWSVSPEGCFHGVVASQWADGELCFTVGEHWRSMYYLLLAE